MRVIALIADKVNKNVSYRKLIVRQISCQSFLSSSTIIVQMWLLRVVSCDRMKEVLKNEASGSPFHLRPLGPRFNGVGDWGACTVQVPLACVTVPNLVAIAQTVYTYGWGTAPLGWD